MVQILVIDCFDSFVYNLVQILDESGLCTYDIVPADAIELSDLSTYDALLLSPGPGVPTELPLLMQVLQLCERTHHILGICLGHQAIGLHFGAQLRRLMRPLHGHTDILRHGGEGLLRGLNSLTSIGRYHSWVIDEHTLPSCLQVLGVSDLSPTEIMAIRHRELPIYGLQFHPESLMTEAGNRYLLSFLSEVTAARSASRVT